MSAYCDGRLNTANIRCNLGTMFRYKKSAMPLPDVPGRPKDWRDQIKADLAAQVEAGGTLYGIRPDGTWIARTKDGDRVIRQPDRKSA